MKSKTKNPSVWQFTNKRKITKEEFTRFFEKKLKSTIRKYQMPIHSLAGKGIKARVLNSIIKNLPERKGKLSDESLNNISNKIFNVFMNQKEKQLKSLLPRNQPLYFLSDKEILLYAKIKKISGYLDKEKGRLKEIDNFIKIIEQKNQDIRQNIVQALLKAEN